MRHADHVGRKVIIRQRARGEQTQQPDPATYDAYPRAAPRPRRRIQETLHAPPQNRPRWDTNDEQLVQRPPEAVTRKRLLAGILPHFCPRERPIEHVRASDCAQDDRIVPACLPHLEFVMSKCEATFLLRDSRLRQPAVRDVPARRACGAPGPRNARGSVDGRGARGRVFHSETPGPRGCGRSPSSISPRDGHHHVRQSFALGRSA